MKKQNNYDYDAIVIGAGISGLVCGCYLAKAGLKTLIVEQHSILGGYCSSFSRKGYKFDVGVHYIGGFRFGSLANIVKDLDIKETLNIKQFDPCDKIILQDSITYIRAKMPDTIKEFKNSFPDEKHNIDNFFEFISHHSIETIYRKVIGLNFKSVLDSFFKNSALKTSIGILYFGNMGLPPSQISAISAIVFFRDFLTDPGYYPSVGMQGLADCLSDKFRALGGELKLNTRIDSILIKGNSVDLVKVGSRSIKAKYYVSCVDTTQVFNKLIIQETKERNVVNRLKASHSLFAIYIGRKQNLNLKENHGCNIWYFPDSDIESAYKNLVSETKKLKFPGFLISFPSSHQVEANSMNTIQILAMAPYLDRDFWDYYRDNIRDKILNMAENVAPGISQNNDLVLTAIPQTFERYTNNRFGAVFGWSSDITQTDSLLLPQRASLRNLFLAGHWITRGAGQGGVSTVAVSGKRAAMLILQPVHK